MTPKQMDGILEPGREEARSRRPHVSAGPGCAAVWLRWSSGIWRVPAGLDLTSHPCRSLGDKGCPFLTDEETVGSGR